MPGAGRRRLPGVPLISTFWGDPDPYVDLIHDAGALHLHTVGAVAEAVAAAEAGVDVIVAQGGEAGGHVTTPALSGACRGPARGRAGLPRRDPDRRTASVITVNGAPGLLLQIGSDRSVVAVTIDGGRITSLDIVRNPDKLATLGRR